MAIPNWMTNGKIWQVTTTTESGVAVNDGVSFDTSSPSTISVYVQSMLWGSLDPSLIATTDTRVTGVTSSSANPPGQPFHIDYANGTLQCYLDDASTQRQVKIRGAGRTVVTPSYQAGARIISSQDGGGGSTPTWVANDSGNSGRIIKTGPGQYQPRVGATA
jgi:hypothetical protein